MKPFTISATVALFVIEACSASDAVRAIKARQATPATFTLEGYSDTLPYPLYNISVPQDGSTVPITNPLVVYTIYPSDGYDDDQYRCTFVGADGAVTHLGTQQDVDGPQAQISVTCAAPSSSTGYPTASSIVVSTAPPVSTPSTAASRSSLLPPYPVVTGSSPVIGTVKPSASASPGISNYTAGNGTGYLTPFTGDAVRVSAQSVASSVLALFGLFAAL